jgi:hypothetical protein
MNYEIILIIAFSYLLGIFTMWIKERCSVPPEENLPVCHFHPANQESSD